MAIRGWVQGLLRIAAPYAPDHDFASQPEQHAAGFVTEIDREAAALIEAWLASRDKTPDLRICQRIGEDFLALHGGDGIGIE